MNKVLARGIMTIAAVNDGKNGQTPHLHIAYANSPDGKVDFSTDDSKGRAYIGQYVSYTDEPDSTDAGMYTWSRFKGNDAVMYKLVMSGSQFNVKADGSFSPEFISIKAYKVQGENLTQLSPSKNVTVLVTKGESKSFLIKKESFAVRSDKWKLFAYKEDMADVFNVDLLINNKKVDMQTIHVVRDGRNGQDAKVWHVAFSIRNITGKKGETFRLKYGRTVGESTSWYDDNPTNHGFNRLYAVIIDDATGNEHKAVLGEDLNVADFFTGGSMTVRLMNRKTGETLAQDTIYPEAKQGKDAVSYKLIPIDEKVLAYLTDSKEKKVDVRLKYKIMKSAGEQLSFVYDLAADGMALTEDGGFGGFGSADGEYGLQRLDMEYKERPDDSYVVTLKKDGRIVDRRVLPITFKPKVVFDTDTENGRINSEIVDVKGNVSRVERDLKKTNITVGNLSENFTQLQMTSKEISFTVNNGTRPNLLLGSDLDLSEVQDKIRLAYYNGDVIQQNTAKKEELQRQLDATPTNDTAKRNDLQKKINACNDAITTARNQVNECKAAIEKHLGVGISGDMEIGNREMFEYLKGKGVGGSDAIRFKNAYKREDWAKWTNISWRDVPLKQNTTYTISVWVKFKSYGKKGRMYVDCASDDGRYCFGGYRYKEHYYDRADIDEWQRVRYVFDSGASKKMSALNFCCIADEEEGAQCEIWLCRPKLEEGNTATPWCAYDGTVDALLAGGFDIKEKKFTATADNFVVQNNKGEKTFMVDEKGALRSIDTSGKGCIVLRPEAGYISILDSETGKERVMVSKNGIFCLGVKDNNIVFDTGNERGMYAGLDMGAGMFRVNTFNDETIGMQLDIIMNGLPYTGNNNLQYSQLYVDGKNNLKINTGEPIVKFLHPNDVYTMKYTDTTIVANTEPYRDATITLPKNPQVGMEVEIINIGTGFCYLETADDTKIFWNDVKTKETVREHTKISLLYVGGSDNLWIYTTEGVCGEKK